MSLVGTKNITSISTEEKIRTLARTRPYLASYLNSTFQTNVSFNQKKYNQFEQAEEDNQPKTALDQYTRNVITTLFSVEVQAQTITANALTPIAQGITGAGEEVVHGIQGVKTTLNDLLKPVSSATGSTLGTLTNVLKDPLGAPSILGDSLVAVVNKVNPDFANSLDATFKKYKSDELKNLPGQAIGSLRNLASLADSILSVPFAIASDLYNGLMEIMQEIAAIVDSIVKSIFDLFFGPNGILDSIIPLSQIKEFLDILGEVTTFVGGISQLAGGFTMITSVVGQIDSYSSQINSVLTNPAGLASRYAPPQVGQFMGALRNPDQMIQGLLPANITNQLKQIQNVPGLGFVGNMGYGLRGTLESLSNGVITNTINSYASQSNILGPYLNRFTNTKPAHDTQEEHPPQIEPASTNPNIPAVQGVPVQTTPREPIFSQKELNDPKKAILSSPDNPNTISLGAKTAIA